MEQLNITWSFVVAVIGAISLLWGFYKTTKEIKAEIQKPFGEMHEKIDKVSGEIKLIKDDIGVQDDAIKSILRKDLLNLAEKYIAQGYITTRQKETWMALYDSYKKENGNTFVDSLKLDIEKLPVKAEEEKSE